MSEKHILNRDLQRCTGRDCPDAGIECSTKKLKTG